MSVTSILACFLVSAAAMAQSSVAFKWFPRSTPGYTSCTSGSYCLTGFTLVDSWTLGSTSVVGTYPQSSTGTTVSPMPAVGTHVFTLAQNYTDGQGSAHQTTANPGIVVNCKKNAAKTGRTCSYGKSWAGQ